MNDDTKLGLLSIGSAAEYLGISIDTLRRWEKKGRINPLRSPGGHRYYSKAGLDSLFGKRYTRDEETLRRTDEELGKPRSSSQPSASDATNIPDSLNLPNLSGNTDFPTLSETPDQAKSAEEGGNGQIQDSYPETGALPKQTLPDSDQTTPPGTVLPTEPPLLHPIETQRPAAEALPTENRIQDAVQEIPQTNIQTPPLAEAKSEPVTETPKPDVVIPAGAAADRDSFSAHDILLPRRDDNTLSEEEIEKRINTIIKKEEKRSYSNIVLGILSSLMLIVDVILLYVWFTSSRITSPIP